MRPLDYNAVVVGSDGISAIRVGDHLHMSKGVADNVIVREPSGGVRGLPMRGCFIKSDCSGMLWSIRHLETGKALVFFTEDGRLKEEMRCLRNKVSGDDQGDWRSL